LNLPLKTKRFTKHNLPLVVYGGMPNAVTIIFPHQLFQHHPGLQKNAAVYLVEEWLFLKQYNFHQQKLVLHRASMKFYESWLKKQQYKVHYAETHAQESDCRKLVQALAIFSSIVHIGANPPLICFIMRPDSAERHTLSNILETGCYTTNHIHENIYRQAHQTSAWYPKNSSEFDATGLETEYQNGFKAPFVKESIVQLAVEFKERIDGTINNTILIIGEINRLYIPGDCLHEDGYLDIEKAGTISCSGLDSYHTTQRLKRLSYAKSGEPITTATI
jgi:flavin reductase (DIM6/NTAB) family NADH-FMN oxidoreductase RutF